MQELIQEEVNTEMKIACYSRMDGECKPRAKLLLSGSNYPKDMLKVELQLLKRDGGKCHPSRRLIQCILDMFDVFRQMH